MLPARTRSAIVTLARRTGTEHRLRGLQTAAGSYSAWRNRLDDAALITVLAAVLRPDSHCIDVGAHNGTVLEHVVRLAPAGRHLAFEPLREHAQRLAAAFPAVDVRNTALGDCNGHAQFMRRPDTALSSLETIPAGEDPATWRGPILDQAERVTVEMARLDDVLPAGLQPALIKIDVEGTEHAVLQGARETIATHRPVVALEHGLGCTHHGAEAGGIHDLLTDCGLRIFDADGRGPYTRAELHDAVLTGLVWFFFAYPSR